MEAWHWYIVPFALRSSHFVFLTIVCVGLPAWAADATSPVDVTERNTPYAPAATIVPDKQTPAAKPNPRVQDRRFETTTVERQTSALDGQRAAIDVREARDKNVREKDSHRPERTEQPVSAFNHRPAAIATGSDTTKPPTVAKYQDSLTAASASNMARFPALDRATSAKINRFVFRKNPPEADSALAGATVTPAAGGSAIPK
jgi:hypothetical protein